MVDLDYLKSLEEKKAATGLTPEKFSERIWELIKNAEHEFPGRKIKVTKDGTIYLTEISDYPDDKIEILKLINKDIEDLVKRGGEIPEEYLPKEK